MNENTITVQTNIQVPIEKAWEFWSGPEHITQWNFATEEWHCPKAENDLKPGGRFVWRMEAKDGSMGFDYSGTYVKVIPNELIEKKLDDDRMVRINFKSQDNSTLITETFEAENQNPIELQRNGWQAILDNFKRYAES